MIQPELTCSSCRKRSPLNEMKYSKDGSGLICGGCHDKQTNGGISLRPSAQEVKVPVNTTPRKKVEYTCKNCRFKYARAIDFRAQSRLCPNCGKCNVVYNLPNKADDLLRELDEMDDI
jgi:hypothetical protein